MRNMSISAELDCGKYKKQLIQRDRIWKYFSLNPTPSMIKALSKSTNLNMPAAVQICHSKAVPCQALLIFR
jgi:hypothetical protein